MRAPRPAWVVALALAACTDGVTLVTRDLGRDAAPPADAVTGGDAAPSADTAPPRDGASPADAIAPTPGDAGPDGATDGADGAGGAPDAAPDAAVDDFEALMAEGLRRLSVGQNHEARAPFDAALALRPTRADAAFALSLAETLDALELAGMLLTLPGQIAAISRNDAVAEALHGELLGIRDELARALDRVDALDPAEVTLDVPAAWIYLSVGHREVRVGALVNRLPSENFRTVCLSRSAVGG